ncbi:MAG: uracil phosphoribosyltransferase [Sphingobacteriaceae bacterium]
MPYILTKSPSVGNQFLAELRDAQIQKDPLRFRKNLERLGEIFAYEISKTFKYTAAEVETPLGLAQVKLPAEQPVVATILRAGLPLHQGFLNYFDRADSAFIGAYRKSHKSGKFTIERNYFTAPDLSDRVVILVDPMLATGQSMVLCCKELLAQYKIKALHVVALIASTQGLAHVKAHLPKAHIWLGDVDDELTSKSYIVPGLGDAGDLAFGEKL